MNADPKSQVSAAQPRGWHGRGYLPHFDGGNALPQFVTFRLADSLPDSVIPRWQEEMKLQRDSEREARLYRLIEAALDAGHGSCRLAEPIIAEVVETALLFFEAKRYPVHSWVIMPNHVHVLFSPVEGWSVSRIVSSWKSFTSKEINKLIDEKGRVWQEDYFDRFIRNEHHMWTVVEYIEHNPVKAGLCTSPELWPYGSARFRRNEG